MTHHIFNEVRDIYKEIIVDNFCGGGGVSLGLKKWSGRAPHIATNHSPVAIAMHRANHPETLHYPEDIFNVPPSIQLRGRAVSLAWFSPDCRHFSRAAGRVPVSEMVRGLAWSVLPWAALPVTQKPRLILLENVPEFSTWGPLDDQSRPDPKLRGETYRAFLAILSTGLPRTDPAFSYVKDEIAEYLGTQITEQQIEEGFGYKFDTKVISCADVGAPTRRRRFILAARCDGEPLTWPEKTHAPKRSPQVRAGRCQPYKTAATDVIDWSIPAKSIFDRQRGKTTGGRYKSGLPLSLAPNTLRRVAKGFVRLVERNPEPYIIRIGQTGFGGDKLAYPIDEPLTTIVTKAEHCLVIPHLVHLRGTCKDGGPIDGLVPTVTSGGSHIAISLPWFVKYYGTSTAAAVDEPIHTVTTRDRFALASASCVSDAKIDDEARLAAWHVARFIDDFGRGGEGHLKHLAPPRPSAVVVNGYMLVDILFRMLVPRELYRANGFPDDYIIDSFRGQPISKADQIARCGNSVPPQLSEALASAMLPRLSGALQKMAA